MKFHFKLYFLILFSYLINSKDCFATMNRLEYLSKDEKILKQISKKVVSIPFELNSLGIDKDELKIEEQRKEQK